ncbi:hypothetical protein KY318_03690, partial [Candidatus Woesearchaeota archaeon]|nr:hypothetical protein [Candidatus Woesearchaeota archaeon]
METEVLDKERTLKLLMEQGILLSPKLVERLSDKEFVKQLVAYSKQSAMPLVVDEEVLTNIESGTAAQPQLEASKPLGQFNV